MSTISNTLEAAFSARADLHQSTHTNAYRLLHGFTESLNEIAVDRYANTILINDYRTNDCSDVLVKEIANWYATNIDFVKCILVKKKRAEEHEARCGKIIYGAKADRAIVENDIRYRIDLKLNMDASFYLDTRNVRRWLYENMAAKRVLNTFSYTGSLGVAALAGGAKQLVQTDLKKQFLTIAKESADLNNLETTHRDYVVDDFWTMSKRFRASKRRFDCVILDPPFFSSTRRGKFDLNKDTVRLINKIRPLVDDDGYIVSVNNSLYLDGETLHKELTVLCEDPHIEIEKTIDVPTDFIGVPNNFRNYPSSPHPYNSPTKITLLKIVK